MAILRNPGYNVAYWNLAQRKLSNVNGTVYADNELLRFVHFSRIAPSAPELFSIGQDRFSRASIGALRELYDRYIAEIVANARLRDTDVRTVPYAYAAFPDEEPIHSMTRAEFRRRPVEKPFQDRRFKNLQSDRVGRMAEALRSLDDPARIELSFRAGGVGELLLGEGWSCAEAWGVWSDGPVSFLTLPIPADGQLWEATFEASAFVGPAGEAGQRIRVSIDGREAAVWTLATDPMEYLALTLGGHTSAATGVKLRLEFPDSVSPIERGHGTDTRRLGLALRRVVLKRLKRTDPHSVAPAGGETGRIRSYVSAALRRLKLGRRIG